MPVREGGGGFETKRTGCDIETKRTGCDIETCRNAIAGCWTVGLWVIGWLLDGGAVGYWLEHDDGS